MFKTALCVWPKQLQTQLTLKILLLFQVNPHWNIGNTKWGRHLLCKIPKCWWNHAVYFQKRKILNTPKCWRIYLNIVEMQMIAICDKSNSNQWMFLAMLSTGLKKKIKMNNISFYIQLYKQGRLKYHSSINEEDCCSLTPIVICCFLLQ